MTNIKKFCINYTLLLLCSLILASCELTKSSFTRERKATDKVVEVAILMPLTGPYENIGNQYNDLIKMGLMDGLDTHINITSYDSSTNEHLLSSMEEIIAKDTKIILGPLFSPMTQQIAEKAKAHGIIVITMSNNPVLADENVFVFGHAPLKQLDYIMSYFLKHNYKNFITILPDNQYSGTVNNIIQARISQNNGSFVHSELYRNTPESIAKAVKVVSDKVDNLNEMIDTNKVVVYISDEQKSLDRLLSTIKAYNLDKKAIIVSDNRIDTDHKSQVDIAFTGSLNILNTDITQRVATQMGIYHMSFMHKMAYDLGLMTAHYIGEDYSKEKFLARLDGKTPFMGISGGIYFIDSIAQRNYEMIKRENGIYTTLDN